MSQRNVGIYIYDQAEGLDFAGPFGVFLVGENGRTVSVRGGFSVNPAYGFHDHPPVDVIASVQS